MKKTLTFDSDHSRRISECRRAFLKRLLHDLSNDLDLKTALDAGCGVGFFSKCLSSLSLKVTAFDAREENITEAKRRHPEVEFDVQDVEDPHIQQFGQFDLVLCFGLFYHLENPFRAICNLHAITGKILIIESMVSPAQSPVAVLVNEAQGQDQGLQHIAFIPSESCFVKMLYNAGFPKVYKAVQLPNHEDFRNTLSHKRRRGVIVASKVNLQSRLVQWVPEPQQQRPDLWLRKWVHLVHLLSRFTMRLQAKLRAVRGKLFPWLPLPVRLPWGGWWLAGCDVMSRHVRRQDGFEQGERNLLLRFLQPGMIVLDLGAHHGLYTLLSSRRVATQGRVIAFEPSLRERRRLEWHIRINRCTNVQVEHLALGSSEGVAELFVCLGQETGCNSLRPPAVSEPTKPIQVSVTTLDNYLKRSHIDIVDFIKVDVEGAEMEVLRGAPKLLTHESRPIIICELADVRTEPWGYRAVEIYEFLAARGYQWFSITIGGGLQPCLKKDHFHENLFAVPKEKLERVAAFVEKLEE